MFNNLQRAFKRAAKHVKHEPLTVADLTVIRPLDDPGTTYTLRARRQYDSEYWKIYGPGNLVLPREWCRSTQEAGLTLEQTLDRLEEIEKKYADNLRGKRSVPYNHFSKVREMLARTKPADDAAPAPAVETDKPIILKPPLSLKQSPSLKL